MNTNWAAENLQAIRTLMERSAIYRRALAPVMTFTGMVGIIAAAAGFVAKFYAPRGFAFYWMGVSLVAIGGDFLLVRRQALKDGEPFWSPPTRRVSQAITPALYAGLVAGIVFLVLAEETALTTLLAVIWIILYGCALHAAGFFMPRGIRLFGWSFLLGGTGLLLALVAMKPEPPPWLGHAVMGIFFGGLQLAYGIYLYFTEKRKNEV